MDMIFNNVFSFEEIRVNGEFNSVVVEGSLWQIRKLRYKMLYSIHDTSFLVLPMLTFEDRHSHVRILYSQTVAMNNEITSFEHVYRHL